MDLFLGNAVEIELATNFMANCIASYLNPWRPFLLDAHAASILQGMEYSNLVQLSVPQLLPI